jgi:sulfur oxygenase/reductase
MSDNVFIAINKSKVANNTRSFATMKAVGPKVCIATAGSPGFLGYESSIQMGALPMAGRYGAAGLHMERELDPVRLYQYTVWNSLEDHANFHNENFARVFELCYACLSITVEGPWEPIYRVVASKMPVIRTLAQMAELILEAQVQPEPPRLATPSRIVALGEYTVQNGRGQDFEQGIIETLEAISTAPGFLGYMVLEQVGVNPLASLMFDPKSMMETLQTFGANPPSDPMALFESSAAAPSPPEYLVHTEWETAELAEQGLSQVLVNHEIRQIHNQGVLPNLIRGPYVMLFDPMMEEPSWRQRLGIAV